MTNFFNNFRKRLDQHNFFRGLIFLFAAGVVLIQLPKLLCDWIGWTVDYSILGILSAIAAYGVVFAYLKLYPEYKMYYKENLMIGLLFLFILFLYLICTFVLENYSKFTLSASGLALITGLSEEIGNREIMISQLFRKYLKEQYIPIILILTSIFFSLLHVFNLFYGQSLYDTINQCAFTLGFGFLMGAIFIRTGNVLPCIIAHFINNFLAFCCLGFKDHSMLLGIVEKSQVIYYVFFILMIFISFYIVRKSKREDIIKLWKEKWNVK